MRRLTFVLLPALIVASACSEDAPERTDDAREATGEVLGGSISDDMLPLDQLQSQSPPIREERTVTVTGNDDGSTQVDTTVTVTSGDGADIQPAPPEPPATPEG
jgi:hypothetical protein